MVKRPYWIERNPAALKKRRILWLAGVRRAGKATLATTIPEVVYLNCDLPSVLHRLQDSEMF
jgi:predicted AAA+ superfamily ATPase